MLFRSHDGQALELLLGGYLLKYCRHEERKKREREGGGLAENIYRALVVCAALQTASDLLLHRLNLGGSFSASSDR